MSESESNYAEAVVEAAGMVTRRVKARAVLVYEHALPDPVVACRALSASGCGVILIRHAGDPPHGDLGKHVRFLEVPDFKLTRMDQIKMATLIAFSQRLLNTTDTFVALTGVTSQPLDTLVVMKVGAEYELFQSVDQPKITEHVRRVVFQRVLTIALELAQEGREGRPVGALFVIGSDRELSKYMAQNIINPFHGYTQKQRNILDDAMRNTVKEFAAIDGAFVIKGNGVIVSAGTTLRAGLGEETLPQGLGTRHAAAAAITASTRSIAITVSESTGTVRLWRRGKMITELEQAPRTPTPQVGMQDSP